MGNIQPEITRIAGAKTTLGDYLKANGVAVAAGEKIDVLAGKLSDISSLTLESLSITTPPTQTEYTAGDSFNPAGMVVAANFSNGASLSITNYTCSPAALTASDTAVTVSLTFGSETKSVQQPVTVNELKSMSYSGTHTVKEITVGGVTYTQYTITGSGTLTVEGTYNDAAIWLCGGGANGTNLSSSYDDRGYGGAGAYAASAENQTLSGTYAVTVGAAQGATSFGTLLSVNAVSGRNGGSGGGGAGGYNSDIDSGTYPSGYGGGSGDGQSKIPFGDSTTFNPHCAGGGGGAYYRGSDLQWFTGGAGGSNGGSGGAGRYSDSSTLSGGSGGNYGGGAGGSSSNSGGNGGSSARFYGSGGGGGGCKVVPYTWSPDSGSAGSGYQGVVYIRVPA